MYKERSPAPQSRLDSLLKRQAESLQQTSNLDSWKSFRTEVRKASTDLQPSRKVDELRALNRQNSPPSHSPNHSFLTSGSHNSPLRERMALLTQTSPSHVASLSSFTDRRYQSPLTKARERFDAFYDNIRTAGNSRNPPPEKRPNSLLDKYSASATFGTVQLPPKSPSSFQNRLQGIALNLPKRSSSPTTLRPGDLSGVISLDNLLQAKELVQKGGLTGLLPTYLNELKAFAQLILAQEPSSDE